jgi:predicted Zn-dependent peptidase
MMLGLETSDSWMSHIAKNEIYFGKAISLEDIAQGVRSVTRSNIIELASSIFSSETMALTLLGDFDKKTLNLSLSV